MNPFDKVLFKTPKLSRNDRSNTNKLSMPAGKLVPIWWKDMTPNEQIKLSISQVVKTAPMVAPIYDRLKLETFAFFVPYRLIWDGAEQFFNLSTPVADRPPMPKVLGYFGPKSYWTNNNISYDAQEQKGDLMDYLGYPLYRNYIDYYVNLILSQNLVYKFDDVAAYTGNTPPANYGWWTLYKLSGSPIYPDSSFAITFPTDPDATGAIFKFYYWLYFFSLKKSGLTELQIYQSKPSSQGFSNLQNLIDYSLSVLGYSNESEAFDAYKKYLFNQIISQYTSQLSDFSGISGQSQTANNLRESLSRSSLPLRAYWRIVADWFINSNFEDPDTMLDDLVFYDYSDTLHPERYHLASRYWENDYFTSAFASTQSGTDVPIPSSGTIKDLRNANALQKLMERVIYNGKRYIDQIWGIFGAKSSDTRLDRCEVLGKSDFVFGIDEITQNSETNAENPLGSFAGRALTAGKDTMFHYHVEEHGMIMIMACIKPIASYIGVQDRLLFKTSPYDFLIPQFAQVGEQPILSDELQQVLPRFTSDIGKVFGYQRRYAEYMLGKHNEVHGDFADNMDYWTMARKFDNIPVLNKNFLQITDSDNLNRAFAVPSAKNHYYCYFNFIYKYVEALPRYINYDL